MIRLAKLILPVMILSAAFAVPAYAQSRNAAFLDPASGQSNQNKNGAPSTNNIVADPPQTDAGETLVNVARRVTVFFYNGLRSSVALSEMMMNADGNVRSKILSDDCKVLKNLPSQSRCSVVLEVIPSSPGPWSVELLLNHTGQGRIARAEIVGSTLGKTDEKSEGLAVSKKISTPVDFGTVRSGSESAARTMLIENDSTEPLKINSVDLIAREQQGLMLRPEGCKQGDELKPGESCPITIIWQPSSGGNVATDLIVHHSGNLGFVVVPIRGISAGGDTSTASNNKGGGTDLLPSSGGMQKSLQPSLPTSPPSLDQIARSLPTIDSHKLKNDNEKTKETAEAVPAPTVISLIGTVNGRAILGDSAGESYVLSLGESTSIGGTPVSLLQLDNTRAVVKVGSTRQEIHLRRASTIMRKDDKAPEFEVSGGSGGGGASAIGDTARGASTTPSSSPGGSPGGLSTGTTATSTEPLSSLGLSGGPGFSPNTTSSNSGTNAMNPTATGSGLGL
jgi:hypothetical protein